MTTTGALTVCKNSMAFRGASVQHFKRVRNRCIRRLRYSDQIPFAWKVPARLEYLILPAPNLDRTVSLLTLVWSFLQDWYWGKGHVLRACSPTGISDPGNYSMFRNIAWARSPAHYQLLQRATGLTSVSPAGLCTSFAPKRKVGVIDPQQDRRIRGFSPRPTGRMISTHQSDGRCLHSPTLSMREMQYVLYEFKGLSSGAIHN